MRKTKQSLFNIVCQKINSIFEETGSLAIFMSLVCFACIIIHDAKITDIKNDVDVVSREAKEYHSEAMRHIKHYHVDLPWYKRIFR